MQQKNFCLQASEIKELAPGHGGCMASDMITVHGKCVGYMYRVMPDPRSDFSKVDSGWVFLSGTESQDYLDDPRNIAIYDVNTIANYDPDIIPLLDAPFGSAFARDPSQGQFVPGDLPPAD